MRPLQRLLKKITEQKSVKNHYCPKKNQSYFIRHAPVNLGHITSGIIFPKKIDITFQLKAIPIDSQDIVFQNIDIHNQKFESLFYDTSKILPQVREFAAHAQFQSIQLNLVDIDWKTSDTHFSLEEPNTSFFFQKRFAYPMGPLLRRRQMVFQDNLLTQPSGHIAFGEKILDIMPWGGFYQKGCNLDQVQNYFVQPVFSERGEFHFDLSHGGFWREQQVNPFQGGNLHGYNVCISSFSGGGNLNSFADDIAQGLLQIRVKYGARYVGTWKSLRYQYLSHTDEKIIITFEA